MSQLFGILFKLRHMFLFFLLQYFCFFLIRKNSVYWEVSFFNSTNAFVAKTLEWKQRAISFIKLGEVNGHLATENVTLRKELTRLQEEKLLSNTKGYKPDSVKSDRFDFVTAKVVSSTVNLVDNYITIDKGTKDGIKPGMGVTGPQGVVGQVMTCNDSYSRVSSILHSGFSLSAEAVNGKLRQTGAYALGVCKWNGLNPRIINLNNVDRFKQVFKGDSVLTSSQNSVFPPSIMVGKITRVTANPSEAFYDISVRLSTDFSSLVYVYIVNNKLLEKQKQVEQPVSE